jgi:hypothetical protein
VNFKRIMGVDREGAAKKLQPSGHLIPPILQARARKASA